MPRKKLGAVIGSVAGVAVLAFLIVGIGKIDSPIQLVKSNASTEKVAESDNLIPTFNTNDENTDYYNALDDEEIIIEDDVIFEEDIVYEEMDIEDILSEEINPFSETTTRKKNVILVPVTKDRTTTRKPTTTTTTTTTTKPTTTKPTTTKPTTTKNSGGIDSGFELDPSQSHFFTSNDTWQRNFGFHKIYDDAAPLIAFYYDTERMYFSYGGYDWLVQLWKGQYGFLFIGSEIGVYHKEPDRKVDFYDCASDENSLYMKMALYRDEKEVLFNRPVGYYWWSTGFVPGKLDSFADRSELKMVAQITLKDAKMRDAFLEAFEKAGFVEKSKWVKPAKEKQKAYAREKYYTVSGNTVSFTWR